MSGGVKGEEINNPFTFIIVFERGAESSLRKQY